MADAGQLVVHIKADTSQFHTELGRAQGEIQKTGSMFAQMGAVAGGMLAAQGIARLADGLGSLVGAGIQFNSTMQQATMAFETMLGSSEAASAHIQELRDFAKQTAFSFSDLTKQSTRLQAYGFAVGEVVPILKTVSDAVSALGGGSPKIDSITRALGQMSAKGKVSAEEMMQLTEAGVKGWDYLAKATGKSIAQVQADVTAGNVASQQAIQAILAGMEKDFGGLGAKYAKSWEGILNNLGDVWEQISGSIMGPAFERMGKLLGNLLDWLQEPAIAQAAEDLGRSIGFAFDTIVQGAQNLGGLVKGGFDDLQRTFGQSAADAFTWGSNIVIQLASGIIDAAGSILTRAMGFIGDILSYWLEGHSPPRVAKDLDLWGKAAGEEWIKGFTKADYSMLDQMGNTLQGVLRGLSLQGEAGFEGKDSPILNWLGSRPVIAEAISNVWKLGSVSQEAIDLIAQGFGSASSAVAGYLRAQLDLIPATQELERAQYKLNGLLKEEQGIRKANDKVAAEFERRRLQLELQEPTARKEAVVHRDAKGKITSTTTKTTNQGEIDTWRAKMDALQKEEKVWRSNERLKELARKPAQDAAEDELKALKEQEKGLKDNADAQAGWLKVVEDTAKMQEQILKIQEEAAKKAGLGGAGGGPPQPTPSQIATKGPQVAKDFNDELDRLLGTTKQTAVSALEAAMTKMGTTLSEKFKPISDSWAKMWDPPPGAGKGLKTLLDELGTNIGKVQAELQKMFDAEDGPESPAHKWGLVVGKAIVEGIQRAISDEMPKLNIPKEVVATWEGLRKKVEDTFGAINSMLGAWKNLDDAWNNSKDGTVPLLKTALDTFLNDTVKPLVSQFWDWLRSIGAVQKLVDTFVNVALGPFLTALDQIKKAADLAKDAFNLLAGAIGLVQSLAGSAPPAKSSDNPNGIDYKSAPGEWAAGGIITRPILSSAGWMGEAGPEAIVPLDRLSGGLGGGTVNVSFPSLIPYSPAQMREAARILAPYLTGQQRLGASV